MIGGFPVEPTEKLAERKAPVDPRPISELADALRESLLAEGARKERERLVNRVRDAVNASCACGGSGPDDPNCCPACQVWHILRQ